MFRYDVYGVRIESSRALPGLIPARGSCFGSPVEVVRRVCSASDVAPDGTVFHVESDRVHIRWPEVGAFVVEGGRRIAVAPLPEAADDLIRQCLLALALPALLHQRGQLVLHASTLSIGGRAVALAGGTGAGKSTITAALLARGHYLLSDDVTVVDIAQEGITVQPGFPQIKLWPDTAVLLCPDVESLPRVEARFEKRTVSVSDRFWPNTLPIERIFILCDESGDGIAPSPPHEAFQLLLQYSYCAGLVPLTDPVRHFRQCGALATRVPLKRLRVRRSLADLPVVAGLVEDDLARPRMING